MSGRTKIKLPWQTKVSDNLDVEGQAIINLIMPEDKLIPEPTAPTDVINRQYVEGRFSETSAGFLGAAEDGSYTDGLFQDFTDQTRVGVAVDRFNELFKALAPAPAPNLSNITIADSGVSGKLTFGSSGTIAGYTIVPSKDKGTIFTTSGTEIGIFNASTTINGDVAGTVPVGGTNNRPYPAKAFSDGNVGFLRLEVNGIIIHSVNLATFGSGSSINANNSGFVLTAADAIKFDSGQTLDLFKFRTGTWTVDPADQRYGYNKVRVRHEYATGLFRDTNSYEWVVDANATATTFTGEVLNNPVMSGNRKISGVTYHTSGTVDYSVTINNAYKNTYSSSISAVSHSGTNVSPASEALPLPADENSTFVLSGKTLVINNASRLLNDNVTANTRVDRTVQTDVTSTGQTISGFLVDNIADDSSDTSETFNGEGYRIHDGIDITSTTYGTGKLASPFDWDGAQNLISGDTNHNKGLLVAGGKLSYPKNTSHISGITAGNFSNVALGPGGNPDYSVASGNRTFIRYFYSALSYSNIRLNVAATGTTFVTLATGVSGNNLTAEVLAPNTTKNTGGAVEWKDAVLPHNANDKDKGCFASTFGDTIPTNWGLTLGAQNTSTSGHVVCVRFTAAATWTGSIDSITLTWL